MNSHSIVRGISALALTASLLPLEAWAASPQGTSSQGPFPVATPESVGIPAAALEALATEVDGYVARDLIVGGELLVIKDRRTVLHRSFGLRDREKGLAWTNGTVCNIRSMTKTLTGAAAQLLIDRGELFLDDKVADHLPGFDTKKSREITVEQLLTHRAGLPLTILTDKLDAHADLVAQGNAVGARGPDFEPGSRFWYSDAGTDAVGAIVEVLTGMKLDAFVQEELLLPLGMSDSFYYLAKDDPRKSSIASAYIGAPGNWSRFFDPEAGPLYPFAWGSQTLYSTTVDYAKFLAMWMDGGRVGERVVLSPDAIARTLTARSEMSMLGSSARFPTSFRGLDVHYGQMAVLHLPIEAKGSGPATIVGHSGSDGTIAWGWPQRDLMVLFFTQSRGGTAALRLEESIDRLLIAPEAYANAPAAPAELAPLLGSYVADWGSHMDEEFTVRWRNGQLALDVPTELVYELRPAATPGQWSYAVNPGVLLSFGRDESGAVDCLTVLEEGMKFEAPRKGSARAAAAARERLDETSAAKFLGDYREATQGVTIGIVVDRGNLAVRDPSGALFHLWKQPNSERWRVRANLAVHFTFTEQEGRIVSCTRRGGGAPELLFVRQEAR
ncbi:MAG: beta-lactamase family protein [Planctomycetes bacterium]|nr:beta-lactamase family protein [Planctomycetota bacterium]